MATRSAIGPGDYTLGTAQTGNVATDVLDRGSARGPAALVITSTVGATPTVTAAIEGSASGSAWYAVPYALVATPSTWVLRGGVNLGSFGRPRTPRRPLSSARRVWDITRRPRMAGRGPAPDPVRIRHDQPVRGDWQTPDAIGWQHGKVPPCPSEVGPATRRAWTTWFASWVAAFWTPEDVPGLRMLALIYDAVERGGFTRAPELRMWMDTSRHHAEGPAGPPLAATRRAHEGEVREPAAAPCHVREGALRPAGRRVRRRATVGMVGSSVSSIPTSASLAASRRDELMFDRAPGA